MQHTQTILHAPVLYFSTQYPYKIIVIKGKETDWLCMAPWRKHETHQYILVYVIIPFSSF